MRSTCDLARAVLHSAGVLLNVLFPNWLLTFLLTTLLLWLTVRIGRKAARLYKVWVVQLVVQLVRNDNSLDGQEWRL